MGFNAAFNTIFLTLLLFAIIGVMVLFSIGDELDSITKTVISNAGLTIPFGIGDFYGDLKDNLLLGIRWVIWFMIGTAIISSFISRNTLTEYLLGIVISVIVAAICILTGSMVWDFFIVKAQTLFTFTQFSTTLFALPSYFIEIITINVFAGAASFVWTKRQTTFLEQQAIV